MTAPALDPRPIRYSGSVPDETGRSRIALISQWTPAVAMMLVSTLSYVDRNTLALLSPTILRETHLSNQQYGYII